MAVGTDRLAAPSAGSTASDGARDGAAARAGDADLAAGRVEVQAVYQPLVDLLDGSTLGYEALARGPVGTSLATPAGLFSAARRLGLVGELDWACRAAAFAGALDAGLQRPLGLFVNAEPEALGLPCPEHLLDVWLQAARTLHLVVELTERELVAHPARLVHVVQELRELGCSIALDDVGAHPDSLTLMPVLEPDVIKLDIGIVQGTPDDDTARLLHAVAAQAERTGALVVAEGIETEEHREAALAYGATVGQGWLFAHPSPDFAVVHGAGEALPVRTGGLEGVGTPFEEVAAHGRVRRGGADVVRVMVRQLLEQATRLSSPPVVLCVVPGGRETGAAVADLQAVDLAGSSALLAVLAAPGALALSPPALQGDLGETDPLGAEWDVVVVGAHFSATVVARRLPSAQAGTAATWAFALTYDREVVVSVARSLLARHAGAGSASDATFPDLVPPLLLP